MQKEQDRGTYSSFDTQSLVKASLVTALYVVLTVFVAPVAYGPIQFRISESLNYFGLYHKRYVAAITLGVVIVNALQSTILDVAVGGFHTFVSLVLSRYLAELAVNTWGHQFRKPLALQYIVMALVFTFTMFIIAWMLMGMGFADYFWETYATLAISQFIVMALGGLIMYYIIDPRLNLHQ